MSLVSWNRGIDAGFFGIWKSAACLRCTRTTGIAIIKVVLWIDVARFPVIAVRGALRCNVAL
jgi:hypothetical protein